MGLLIRLVDFLAPSHALLAEVCDRPRWRAVLAAAAPRRPAAGDPHDYFEVLAALDETERGDFLADYGALLRQAYPPVPGGTVLPFRRVFAVARKSEATR